jgi:uncharacterized protein YbjT (DUF2867 family)
MPPAESPKTCLGTGATGYIGGRLVPELLERGYRVRVLTRSARRLRNVPWAGRVQVVDADAADPEQAAASCRGVERIVHLSGLVPERADLSPHLRSRAEVAGILLASGVPTVAPRAAVILGSGSASFEMLRYLTERLPVMVTPRWVRSRIQPIAVRDVLRYLVGCAELPPEVHRAFDIGGPDIMTCTEMMQRFAAVSGLPRRRIVPVPSSVPTCPASGSASSRPSRPGWAATSSSRCAPRWCAVSTTSPPTSRTHPVDCWASGPPWRPPPPR